MNKDVLDRKTSATCTSATCTLVSAAPTLRFLQVETIFAIGKAKTSTCNWPDTSATGIPGAATLTL